MANTNDTQTGDIFEYAFAGAQLYEPLQTMPLEEAWRCPQCHRKGLDLLPATGLRKRSWSFWWVLAVLVAIEIVVGWVNSTDTHSPHGWSATADRALMPTLMALGGVTFYLIVGHREKRCPRCGWRSEEQVPLRGDG